MTDTAASEKTEDIEIRLLLEALYTRYHYDFRNYAMASIKRRLKQGREQFVIQRTGRRCVQLRLSARSVGH